MYPQELAFFDKQYVWHPFTQMQDWLAEDPLIIAQGKGNYLYDIHGKQYLDAISSLWVNVHGHQKKEITDAIIQQAQTIAHSTLLGSANIPSILLAKKLISIAPRGLQKVFYSDSGSTAVEISLKMAYQYWQQRAKPQPQKKKFISFINEYHGDTIGAVSVGGIDLFHHIYKPLLFETMTVPYACCYHCTAKDTNEQCTRQCYKKFEETVAHQHEHIAAVIIEPLVQGAAGILTAQPGFLSYIRDVCTRYDVLLIVDEVATGFGKTGKMFACEHEGVAPDIMALGKGITGGYLPLAATLATDDIYNAFLGKYAEQKTFFHGHSYTGNQLACAAACANIDLFTQENVLGRLQDVIARFSMMLVPFQSLPHVGDVRQIGLMAGIELVKDKQKGIPYPWEEKMGMMVCKDMVSKGYLMRPLGNVIVLMPPLSIAEDELRGLTASLLQSIAAITGT